MIKKVEDQYQFELEEMYETLQEQMLKRMRRAVPIMGTKFDWDKSANIIK